VKNRRTACLLLLLAALRPAAAAPAPAEDAAFRTVPDLQAGFRLLYEQKFPEARGRFADWSRENPGDPFGDVSIAASYLFEEFYRQGIMSSDYFLDDKRFLRGIDGTPDAGRMRAFHESLARADQAASQRLKKDPSDGEALFALTLSAGMQSNSLSLLEKKQFDGLRQIKKADFYAERLLSVRPDAADAWLALGSANYIIGSLSGPVRFFPGSGGSTATGPWGCSSWKRRRRQAVTSGRTRRSSWPSPRGARARRISRGGCCWS